MQTTDLDTWEQLEDFLNQIDNEYRKNKTDPNLKFKSSQPLFRGQANANWTLSTTLERATNDTFSLDRYHRYAGAAHRYLSGFNAQRWEFEEVKKFTHETFLYSLPSYGFLAYLRHHGFPSPLLDWTASPYVALFFAFGNHLPKEIERVALFCYQEDVGQGKAYSSDLPGIQIMGPWASTHPRHHLQQCWYSICFQEENSDIILVSHEKGFSPMTPHVVRQDVLTKVTLPVSLRSHILSKLMRMNVTPYSIFQSEDALVQTAAFRIFNDLS
jgi:hypothetical protein